MIGECTGNVRSTPTPKLTLRTVKVSRTPLPWRRITTPWNTWTRSRLPSTTRTCTFRVSPGREVGDVVAQLGAVDEIGGVHRGAPAARADGTAHGSERPCAGAVERPVVRPGTRRAAPAPRRVSVRPVEQVGAARPSVRRSAWARRQRAIRRVVARAQHLGHRPAPELGRPRVLRVLEQRRSANDSSLGRRLVADARRAPAGRPPRSPRAPRPRRRRARSRRPTARRRTGGRRPAGRRPRSGRRAARTRRRAASSRGQRLVEAAPARPTSRNSGRGGSRRLDRGEQRLGRHHHARRRRRTACRRRCGDGRSVQSRGSCTRTSSRPASRACPSSDSAERAVEVLGEDREDVDAHGHAAHRSSRPSGGSTTTRPASCSTTNTIGTSAPLSSTSRSCAGFASTAATAPERAPAAVDAPRRR